MSIAALGWVWDNSEAEGRELLVMLALADSSNNEGVSWPKLSTLARKARTTERTVQRTLLKFASPECRELQVFRGGFLDGKNQSNTYRLLMGGEGGDPPDRPGARTPGDEVSPRQDVPHVAPGVPVTSPPGVPATSPHRTNSREPLVEPEKQIGDDEQVIASNGDAPTLPGLEPPAPPSHPPVHSDADQLAAIEEVWTHYGTRFGSKLRIKALTPHRHKVIAKALRAAGGEDDRSAAVEACKRAIDGLQSYRAAHPERSQKTDLDVIFETKPQSPSNLTDQIEWWGSHSTSQVAQAHPEVPSALQARITRRRIAVTLMLKAEDGGDERVQSEGREALEWLRANAKERPVLQDDGTVKYEAIP
jgi:hypothetical protein